MTRRRRYKPKRYRRKKRKLPLETAVALGTIPFIPAADGWTPIYESAMQGNFVEIGKSLARGFLGIDEQGRFNLFGLLNPFDFNEGRYGKILIVSGIASKIRKSLIKIPMEKIPFIGKYIS